MRSRETPNPKFSREYETVGYVLKGSAELILEGQMLLLNPGDSWVVPKGAKHTYRIKENVQRGRGDQPASAYPRPRRVREHAD